MKKRKQKRRSEKKTIVNKILFLLSLKIEIIRDKFKSSIPFLVLEMILLRLFYFCLHNLYMYSTDFHSFIRFKVNIVPQRRKQMGRKSIKKYLFTTREMVHWNRTRSCKIRNVIQFI